jgi:hypothetical protein
MPSTTQELLDSIHALIFRIRNATFRTPSPAGGSSNRRGKARIESLFKKLRGVVQRGILAVARAARCFRPGARTSSQRAVIHPWLIIPIPYSRFGLERLDRARRSLVEGVSRQFAVLPLSAWFHGCLVVNPSPPLGIFSFVAPHPPALCPETGLLGIFKPALTQCAANAGK